eukprot:TRINITY_DN3692_c0_g1_i4.p1 TRINITY_DN3692_c0_g1~~TRINITY_DN3692_c0_g1_i4.p1  ORF type:complete len:185 (+),score=40.00 TRINITY_DN3692_c0_g1_i4:28-582(+)
MPSFLLLVLALLVNPPVVTALTGDEIAQFTTTGTCIPPAKSTNYEEFCGYIFITEIDNGESLEISTNSIPDHDILKDYLYRDVYRDYCLSISPQNFTFVIPKNPSKNSEPACIPSLSGVALNGVEIWNSYNQESLLTALPQYRALLENVQKGVDAGKGYMGEPMDICGGHPGPDGTSVSLSRCS